MDGVPGFYGGVLAVGEEEQAGDEFVTAGVLGTLLLLLSLEEARGEDEVTLLVL